MLFLYIIFFSSLFSQNVFFINGTVFNNSNKNPISKVNIHVNDSDIGTESDKDGVFFIKNIKNDKIKVTFSHIGYQTIEKELLLPQNKPLIINMEETFFSMDELVITSTRTKKIHKDVPIATEVINKKEILTSGALNVSDLLSQRSGMSISTSVEGSSVLNILGMDSRYILILLDGQPITGRFNSRVSLNQIATSNINQIEIIKGPNSSLYGSEAMGGVINIITDTSNNNNFSLRYRNSGSKNNFNLVDSKKCSRNFQSFLKLNYGDFQSILNIDLNLVNTDKEIEYLEIDDVVKWHFKHDLLFKNNFKLSFHSYQDNQTGSSSLMNNDTYITRNNINFNHKIRDNEKLIIDHTFWIQNYSRQYKQIRPWGELVKDDLTNENALEYEINIIKFIGENSLSIGSEINQSKFKRARIDDNEKTMNAFSLYSQYDIKSFYGLQTLVGLRIDKYSDHHVVSSPRIGVMYSYQDRWKFRTTWGKGFRAPTFMEKYIDWNHIQFGYKVIGNENLVPETSSGFTFGAEYYHPAVYHISLMLYHTQFNNMINDYVIQGGQPTILSYENIKKSNYNGIEIQGKWNITNQATSSWNINFVDNRDDKGESIPNTQPLTANTKLNYQTKNGNLMGSFQIKWTASYDPKIYNPLMGQYTQSTRSSYSIMNLNIQYQIFDDVIIGIGSQNLNNFTDEIYGPFIGRINYIELKYQKKGNS